VLAVDQPVAVSAADRLVPELVDHLVLEQVHHQHTPVVP